MRYEIWITEIAEYGTNDIQVNSAETFEEAKRIAELFYDNGEDVAIYDTKKNEWTSWSELFKEEVM